MKEKFESWIEAPRWAGAEDLLNDLSGKFNCEVDIKKKTGLMYETLQFTFSGEERDIELLKKNYFLSLYEYERGHLPGQSPENNALEVGE